MVCVRLFVCHYVFPGHPVPKERQDKPKFELAWAVAEDGGSVVGHKRCSLAVSCDVSPCAVDPSR